MNSSRFKISDRIMSILLVVLIVVGVMPTTTFAQAAENPKTPETPKFIFSVESFEDGKALSAELSYSVLIDDKVKIEEKSLSIDDEGKAEIEEIAALEEDITNSNVVLIYKVTKNDYKDVSGEYEIKKADDTLSVKLEKIEKVSVTVNVNESNGGIVEIDNESVDGTIKVNKGKEIEIKISTKVAEEFENYKGFHIKSVKINEENQKLDDNNLNNFSKTVKADDNINIDVEFEKYYSFIIEKYSEDCGIVTVNDEKYESGNFDESSQVKLDIKANEGYRISSILINDESEELNDFDKYSKTFYLDKNSSVKVEFVKIYIVNIKYDSSNGKVETDPEIESDGGLVQIGDGSTLHIKAIPNENFRVSNVSVTGFQEEIYDNNNFSIDNPYEKDLEIKQDAEISITFAPMVYKISLGNVSPNGSVTIENNNRTVDYDKTSLIKFIPDKGYKVGKILSNGEDVNDFIKPSEIEDGVYILTINNVKEDKVLDISFIESEKADFDKVEISYSDFEKPLRMEKNDEYDLYVFRNGASAVLKPSDSNIGIRINDAEGVLYDNHEYTIEEDFTIEKIELFYDLGWHEVELENKSIKIAFDSKAPVVQITTESKNTDDFYTSDVDLKFSVKDPDYSSAIKSVKYTIEYDGQEKLFEEKIYTYSEGDEYQTHLDLKETIKAEDFNYDNVKVRLFAEDFAGYTNEDVFELNILTTKPKITADIDGELLKEAKEGYYNKARIAYITFEDRPSAFDKAGVLFEIKKDGETVDDISSMIKWTDDNDSAEKGIYKAEISFTEDGEYEWNVAYKNKADLENEEITDKDGNTITDSTVYNFTIDKVAPIGKISIDKAVWEKLIEELTFGVWKNKEIKVEVTSEDNLSSIKYYKQTFDDDLAKSNFSPDPKSINELIEIYDNEEFVTEPYVVNVDEQFVIYARLADYAGNVSYISTDGVVYDATGSSEQIEITAEKPHSNEYYNTDFDVNVIVNEKVESTKVYSGLNLVSYEVYCDEKKTQSGILFDKTANPDKSENEKALVSETKKSFKIDASKNNSDNVKVVVTAVDNAGNEYSKEAYFKINVDKPTVSIEFDNNEVKKTKDERGYFNNFRTATLTFIDRETTFDEEAAINGIVIEESVDSKGKPVVYDEEAKKYVTIDPKTLLGEWVHDNNKHTITINFDKDANYKWIYKGYTNKSGNQSTDVTAENGTVTPFVFTVDTNKPTGTVTVGNSSWETLLETLTFGLYAREKVYVSATSNDVTSGTEIEYYKTSNTKVLTFDELEKVTDWIEFSGSDLENNGVSPNERFTVYLKITDDAGNYSYISSNGYIVENEHSKITITPETPNENGIYGYKDYHNGINVDVKVTDPEPYSGIKTIDYWVECDGKETKRDNLFTFDIADPIHEQLKNEITKSITVDPMINNSCNTVVYVKAVDNAENEYIDSVKLDIDMTAPTVKVVYEDTSNENAKEGYYTSRTAKVYITERPHHFNKNKATESINITAVKYDKEKPVENSYTITGWDPVDEEDGDNTTYAATVTFDKDANYTFSVEYSDEAGNQNIDTKPYEFTVDTHPPEGTITVDNISWSKLFSEIGKILTFGRAKNQTVDVSAKSTDEISDTYIKYYKTSDTTALTFDELEKVTDWKDFKGSELEKNGVSPNERFAIYLKIIDYAGNYSYINSNGYIVENIKSDITIIPEAPNENGVYGRKYIDGIKVDIKVTDPEIYSGIKTVDYWIECDGKETKRENLFTFDITDPTYEQLKYEFTKSITVDPNANNSCNTVVYVKAVDNAENEYIDSVKLDIDITAPTVKVVYEDTSNANAKEGYYTSRTAKVYITERPHHFNADTATKSIDISAQNARYQTIDDSYSVSTWELVGKENNDKTTYVATVSFNKDAHYTFNVLYSDNADNFNNGIDTSNQTAAYDFTVDTTLPSGSITINDKSWDYLFSKVKEKLTFGLFKNTKVSVSANSTDVTSGTDIEYYKTSDTTALTFEELDKITDWTKFHGSELEKNGVSPNERFTIYLKITDYAGNYIYINSNGHIIDNVKSNIEITPETPNENGIYGYKDYHNGINVDVKVTDPEPYSGIKTIYYWVECDGKETQEGNLFTFNITNPTHEQLKNEITKSITVDPMINNSCNTVVYVKTVDNAGNEFINHADLDIDMTIPTVKVVYSDTSNENAKEGFYTSRTAKVYITERPHHFNKDKATESIKITSVDYFGNKVTDSYSIGEWNLAGAEDGDNTTYAATVTFDKDANYTLNVEYYDNADNTNNGIDFANQTAPSKFTVDKTKPTGSVTVDNNPWTKLINILTFGLFKNIKVDVSATSSDATSDTYIEYYKTSKADALTVNELEEITDWTVFKGSALEKNGVSPNEQFVIYLKITDNAGNYDYISSDGFIVDNVHSVIEISPATANKNNAYGLDYNGNVNVGIKVTDPEPYSGIKTVEYWVECDSKETQRENLFTFNVKAPTQKQLKNEWTGTVTVKQKDNNSTNTKIYVKTIDNAGNEYTQSTPLDIDITEPGIKVTYEDTSNANAREGFFTSRKATIVITERNNHFDSETATQGIKITAVDANGKNISNSYTLSDWETVENKEYDKTTHTATIDFNKDANYTFSIEYIDKADNNNLPVDVTGQTTPYKFTVDTNKPTGSITVENNSWAELIKILTFGLFKNTKIDVKAVSNDETSNTIIEYYKTSKTEAMTVTELDKLNEWTSFKNSSLEKNGVSPNEQFVIYLRITDDAGNYTYISSDGYIVDDVASNIVITPETPNRNNLYGLKYSNGINVDVDVEDSEPYSGIKTVDYWVESDGVRTQEENLFTFNIDSPTQSQLVNKWTGSFKVDTFKNNSCNTNVYVKTVDNAGNEKTENITIDIDVTRPNIKIEYNSTSNANAREGYFTSRTATITITERTHHFNSANATNNIKITAADISGNAIENSYSISDWSTQEGITPDSAIHTATIWYNADANYKFSISYTDNADNENPEPDVTNQITPYEFTVDKTRPTGTVTASSAEGRTETWSSLVDSLRFGFWSNSRISVSGTSNDVTSPIASVQYYMPIAKNAVDETEALISSDLDKVSNWTDFNGFDVTANNQFTVYIRIVDYAGNYTYIGTNGLIVDDQHPVDESVAPEITVSPEYPLNGIYKGDVNVSIQVDDPLVSGTYSGLKEITYSIFDRASANPNSPTQSGTLYTFNNSDPKQSELLKTWTGSIKVDSSVNNSNEIQIVVYAVDNAGNAGDNSQQGSQGYTVIKIDVTSPTIDISYNNNNADNKTFFNAERVATVRVTERNFDSKDVKVTITNTDGVVPSIVGWNSTSGSYNGDDSVHTATITYSADGDYKFEIEYTDLAGNKCSKVSYADGSVAPTEFTIDKTLPTVSVAYDNNSAQNGNYYKNNRTATITVNEHNFDSSRVTVSITASNDGNSVTIPTVNGWNNAGNLHTATVLFSKDALYTFDISVKDKANNTSAAFEKQSFYIDKTAPTVKISGVTDQSANKGDCIPVITYSDTNFDSKQMTISLVGVNRKNVEPTGQYSDIHNGKIFTFNNFAKEKNIDDIYTLSASLKDKAGNSTTDKINFSVNRFGSVYTLSDETVSLNGSYSKSPVNIVLTETNANKLKNIKITVFKNNETIVLKEDKDYNVEVTGGNGKWYEYKYTLFKKNFEEDGIYRITIHSEDDAGNVAENTLDTKDMELSFGIDKTPPTVNVKNLESGETYAFENWEVHFSVNDNLKLTSVVVYLDNEKVQEWKDVKLSEIIDNGDDFSINIPGNSKRAHNFSVIATDSAENKITEEINGFFVTTDPIVRYTNNKPLFFGSISGVILLIGFIVFIVSFKRKKK